MKRCKKYLTKGDEVPFEGKIIMKKE